MVEKSFLKLAAEMLTVPLGALEELEVLEGAVVVGAAELVELGGALDVLLGELDVVGGGLLAGVLLPQAATTTAVAASAIHRAGDVLLVNVRPFLAAAAPAQHRAAT